MSDNKRSQGMLGLPVELNELIGSFMEPKDLGTFRPLCHETYTKIQDYYAKAMFYRLLEHFGYEWSLKHAISVVEHPVFGQEVRQLSLYIERVFNTVEGDGEQTGEELWGESDEDSDEEQSFVPTEGHHNIKLDRRRMDLLVLLVSLICRLKDFGKPRTVELVDMSCPDPKPKLPASFKGGIMTPRAIDGAPLQNLLKAFDIAKFSALNLLFNTKKYSIPAILAVDRSFLSCFRTAHRQVEVLKMHARFAEPNRGGPVNLTLEFLEV